MGRWKHDHSKPVIGISGGIGAGKSTVARLFGELGCCVIDSDALAHEVLQTPGHIQNWSQSQFLSLVSRYFEVLEVRSPVPWTMLLCRNWEF